MKHPIAVLALLALTLPGLSMAEEAMQQDAPSEQTSSSEQQSEQQIPGRVARATFTSGINEREPVDGVDTINTDNNKIYYFTELRDMAGTTVTHRWEHNGQVMAEVPFEIGGNRWRVYSSKSLDPSLTGEWKASVVDANGSTLSANTFTYNKSEGGSMNQEMDAPETNSAE